MVFKSTSLNRGVRATVFSIPMTDWNALLRLSLFTLLMTMVGLSRTQAQCSLMYNDPSMNVALNVGASNAATLDAAALMPFVTVTGAGCTNFMFYDALGTTIGATVNITCDGSGSNGPGTYLATVDNGPNLSNFVTFQVTIIDNQDPTFIVPPAIAINCEANPNDLMITGDATGEMDNCATGIQATYTDDVSALTGCNGTGTIVRTWTLNDGNGNSVSQTQNITVQDVTEPTFTVPADVTIDACNDNINDLSITGSATMENDNCSTGLTATYMDMPAVAVGGGCPFDSTILRVWTLVDACNNVLQLDQIITKEDRTIPSSTQGAISVDNNTGTCDGTVVLVLDAMNTTDNCSSFANLSITNSFNAGGAVASGNYPVGMTTVTFTITDLCGQVAAHDVLVTVADTTKPTITGCPMDITVNSDPGNCDNTVSWAAPTITDNCSAAAMITEEIIVSDASVIINTGTPGPGRVDFADFPVGTSQVSYAYKDGNGVTDTCRFTVTVLDTEVPIVTCPANQVINFGGCNAANELVPDYRSLVAVADNCSNGFTVTQVPAPNSLLSAVAGVTPADTESFMVTFTVSDNNANNLSANCSITVTLNEDGSITPSTSGANLPTMTSTCGSLTICAPTATDECGNLLAATPNPGAGATISGTCSPPCTPNPPVTQTIGVAIADNSAAGTNYTLTVAGQGPIIADMDFSLEINHTWVGDLQATLESPNGTVINLFDRPGSVGGTVGCSADNMNITFSDDAPNTAADLEGTCNFGGAFAIAGNFQALDAFSAFDGENPNGNWVLNVADNAFLDMGSVQSVGFNFCTNSGATINQYEFTSTSTVTWTYDDGNGNLLNQLQLINVSADNAGPSFTCEDITVELDDDGTITVPATSILGESLRFDSGNLGFGNGAGSTNYCYTATTATTISFDWDYISNNSNAFFDPFGVSLNGFANDLATGNGAVIVDIPSLAQSGSFSIDLAMGDVFCITANTMDNGFGNSQTTVSNLVVGNGFFAASDWTETTFNSDGGVTINAAMATDNCGVDFSTLTLGGAATWEANCGNIGTNNVLFSLSDINGNASTCMANITVVDNQAPTFTNVANDTTVTCGNLPMAVSPTILDNCSTGLAAILNTTSTQSGNPNTCTNYSYVVTRTWSTTDNAGNVASAVQTITVQDTEAPTNPVFAGVSGTVSAAANSCDAAISLALTDVTDCAAFANMTVTNNSIYANANGADASGTYPLGTHNINFNVTDPCGNSVSFNRVFTVIDDVSPIAICKSVTLGLPSNGSLTLLPGFVNDGSTDNCTSQANLTYSVSPTNFDCSHADGTTQWPVTFSVTDQAGRTATCNTFVVIQDNFIPTVTCRDITIELDQNGSATITPADVDNGSFDNCTATGDLIYSLTQTTFTNVGVAQTTLNVEDSNGNIGSCNATVTVQIPEPCMTVGVESGASGTVVTVPITVTDFVNVGGFQFYLLAGDPSILDIQDVRALPSLDFGSFVTNAIGDDSIRVIYNTPNALIPITLADNEAIIEIDILLTGMVGDASLLTLTDDNPNGFRLQSRHIYNGATIQIDPFCTNDGGIAINAPASLTIAGDIFTEDSDPVGSVYVNAIDGTNSVAGTDQTGTDGIYNIFPVFSGDDYVITPTKDTNWTNGVTPFDLSVIQQHIVGLDTLDSPYKKIAADAFKDNLITTFDVLQLQILLASAVGGPSNLITPPNLNSWEFVNAVDTPAMLGPLFVPTYNKTKTITNLTMDSLDNDFIGIKIGDVTGNANPSTIISPDADNRSLTSNTILTEDIQLESGSTISVPFSFESNANWIAGQWVFDFDPSLLQFVDVKITPNSGLKEADFGTDFINNGKISVINYDAVSRLSKADDILFELVFDVTTDQRLSEILSINESVLKSQIYASNGATTDIAIGYTGSVENPTFGANELMQNRPNPFVDQTTVSFVLAEGGNATLTFTDVAGRIIKVIDQDFAKGYNEVQLSKNDLPEDGIYFYRIESGDFQAVKKMTLLNK